MAGYRVYRNESTTALVSLRSPSYSDRTLSPGTEYRYTVRAYDRAGNESTASNAQAATTPSAAIAPEAPGAVLALPADSKATVSWVAPNDGGSAITRYVVTRNPGGESQQLTGNVTTTEVSGLTNGNHYTFAVLATNAVGDSPLSASSASVTPTAAAGRLPAFPISHAASARFLQDRAGAPFPILGRTAWFLVSLSQADYRVFLSDTAARGYNTIELHVLNHDPRGNRPPFAGNGELPFLKRLDGQRWTGALTYSDIGAEAPDFSTPNPAYWAYVDALLAECEAKGLLVFFFPAYVGFEGGEQGWMREMVANGASRMSHYGTWIATRYVNRKNLVWMAGGDYASFDWSESNVEAALLSALRAVPGQQSTQLSAEWESQSIATDQSRFGTLMTLQGVYDWTGHVALHGRRAYSHRPPRPAFLLEEPYDEEGPDGLNVNRQATQPVRRFQWAGWLSSIGGYISGNGYVWPFAAEWERHLDTQGSRDMARLNGFIRSIAWWQLVPSGLDGMKTLVISGGGKSAGEADYVTAAATRAGTLLVAYVPPAHTGSITIDATVMSGPARARWFNPATALSIDAGAVANTGSRMFAPPADNGTGFADWVLVIEKN